MPPISEPLTAAEASLKDRPWWINAGDLPDWLKVDRVIEGYSRKSGGRVRFVACLSIQDDGERWTLDEIAVFWQEKLIDPSHSHYFGIFQRDGAAIICSAQTAADHLWMGGMHPETGEIIFSRSRWDYRKPRDGSFSCDGGPEGGGSWSGKYIPVRLKIIDGLFRIDAVAPGPLAYMDDPAEIRKFD